MSWCPSVTRLGCILLLLCSRCVNRRQRKGLGLEVSPAGLWSGQYSSLTGHPTQCSCHSKWLRRSHGRGALGRHLLSGLCRRQSVPRRGLSSTCIELPRERGGGDGPLRDKAQLVTLEITPEQGPLGILGCSDGLVTPISCPEETELSDQVTLRRSY